MKLNTKFNAKLLGSRDKMGNLRNSIVLFFWWKEAYFFFFLVRRKPLSSYNWTLWGIYQKIFVEGLSKKHKNQTNSITTKQAERTQGSKYLRKEQKVAYSFMQQISTENHPYAGHDTRYRWLIGLQILKVYFWIRQKRSGFPKVCILG